MYCSQIHQEVCPKFPLACPNNCEIVELTREKVSCFFPLQEWTIIANFMWKVLVLIWDVVSVDFGSKFKREGMLLSERNCSFERSFTGNVFARWRESNKFFSMFPEKSSVETNRCSSQFPVKIKLSNIFVSRNLIHFLQF